MRLHALAIFMVHNVFSGEGRPISKNKKARITDVYRETFSTKCCRQIPATSTRMVKCGKPFVIPSEDFQWGSYIICPNVIKVNYEKVSNTDG